MYHTPVLLQESTTGLNIKPEGTYVDLTFGGGGHSREILKHLDRGRLLAFDQDREAAANLPDDDRITFVNANFRYLKNFLKLYDALPVDGILGDLGVSSHQFDKAERGFSIRLNAKLDMRMDSRNTLTAWQVINNYSLIELTSVLKQYGEIRNAHRLAKEIIQERKTKAINTVEDLTGLAGRFARKGSENQYLAQVFQALRIEVNKELEALKSVLKQAPSLLANKGRIAMISYHSLEDRLVKNFFRSGNFEGEINKDFYGNVLSPLRPVHNKPLTPSEKEVEQNSRARSAKLRIAEKN